MNEERLQEQITQLQAENEELRKKLKAVYIHEYVGMNRLLKALSQVRDDEVSESVRYLLMLLSRSVCDWEREGGDMWEEINAIKKRIENIKD